jgi:hypothetical protein
MKTGMLWFDNDPKTSLEAKIITAADYYRQKYGAVPNACVVNQKVLAPIPAFPQIQEQDLGEGEMRVGRIVVKPSRSIMPGHLWIGVEEV